MTGNAFIKRLLLGLDFLSEDDKKVVVNFYEKKLSAADTLTDEEAIVKSFGSPEHIAAKLKETYERFQSSASEESAPQEEQSDESAIEGITIQTNEDPATATETKPDPVLESDVQEEEKVNNESTSEDELIFSRPMHETPAPEVIHSLENQDVKTLYGEKVEMQVEEQPCIDENDIENGLTPEDIELAKAETLEKAAHFDSENFPLTDETDSPLEEAPAEAPADSEDELDPKTNESEELSEIDASVETIELQEDEGPENEILDESPAIADCIPEESVEPDSVTKPETEEEIDAAEKSDSNAYVPCLFARLFPSISKKSAVTLTVLCSLFLSPILLFAFCAPVLLHAAICALILLSAILLFAFMVALIALGVLELIYGFSLFGTAISVALIELGMGLVLLAIVTAVTALIYEYLFALVPKWIKWFTKLLKRCLKGIVKFLYGGKK